jgi:hypothetical protein
MPVIRLKTIEVLRGTVSRIWLRILAASPFV